MAPETRSRGVPPPSRVYHSTPALQQAQFRSRRKTIRTYGKQTDKASIKSLRQQTLTQIDFVSSFDENDMIELSDSEEDAISSDCDDDDKENRKPGVPRARFDVKEGGRTLELEEEEDDDEDEPVPSSRKRRSRPMSTNVENSKRRRTMGDEVRNTEIKRRSTPVSSRRRTWGGGSSPAPSSKYHTQTLTQILGQRSVVKDSDDDEEDEEEAQNEPANGDFEDWLVREDVISTEQPNDEDLAALPSRAESAIPQTPAKRVRYVIPSSSQTTSTPLSTMIERYPPPGEQEDQSPLKNKSQSQSQSQEGKGSKTPNKEAKTRVLVVEDSFRTESWGSKNTSPAKDQNMCQKHGTSSRCVSRQTSGLSEPLAAQSTRSSAADKTKGGHVGQTPSPIKWTRKSPRKASTGLYEIPDSDEEDQDENYEPHEGLEERPVAPLSDTFVAGPETQFVMNELASSEERAPHLSLSSSPRLPLLGSSPTRHISPQRPKPAKEHSTFKRPGIPATKAESTEATTNTVPRKRRVIRRPLHPPSSPNTTYTQPIESQRVPVDILQSLPPASVRTDIILPVGGDVLTSILGGYQTRLELPLKIPVQVVRFWLVEASVVRFMACIDSIEATGEEPARWRYNVAQMFQLNNPVTEQALREDDLLDKSKSYNYLPPAVANGMLYNLRQAIFDPDDANALSDVEEEEEEMAVSENPTKDDAQDEVNQQLKGLAKRRTPASSYSISQQVEAQLLSDIAQSVHCPTSDDDVLVPSTPEDAAPVTPSQPAFVKPQQPAAPPSARAARVSGTFHSHTDNSVLPHPSQATTASQVSTAEEPTQQPQYVQQPSGYRPPPPPSSNSFPFPEFDSGISPMSLPPQSNFHSASSQLLTRSQMLPDSLIQDGPHAPPEIWDSQQEEEEEE